MHVFVDGLDGGGVHPQVTGDLGGAGGTAELGGQLVAGGSHLASLGPDRAAGPVAVTELVQQGAPDAGGGVAVEVDPALGIEAASGLGQSGHPASEHYADQFDAWRNVETRKLPFTPGAVAREARHTLKLLP